MSGDETIREIKERLKDEGYTSQTIGEVLREVNRSFLADDAGEVIRETRAKALQLQTVLEGIYEALIEEPTLDLRIDGNEELPVGTERDVFDIALSKSAGNRLSIAFESRREHPVEPAESIRLGQLKKRDSEPKTVMRRVVLARITIRPAEPGRFFERLRNTDTYEVQFTVNRDLLESSDARDEPSARFHDCLTFVDFASDRYSFEGYSTLVRIISKLPDRIGSYLGKKREFLDRFDFS